MKKKKKGKNEVVIAKKVRYTYLFLWYFLFFTLLLSCSYIKTDNSNNILLVGSIIFLIIFIKLVRKYKTPLEVITFNGKLIKVSIVKKIIELKPSYIKSISINYLRFNFLIIELKDKNKKICVRVKNPENAEEKLSKILKYSRS